MAGQTSRCTCNGGWELNTGKYLQIPLRSKLRPRRSNIPMFVQWLSAIPLTSHVHFIDNNPLNDYNQHSGTMHVPNRNRPLGDNYVVRCMAEGLKTP